MEDFGRLESRREASASDEVDGQQGREQQSGDEDLQQGQDVVPQLERQVLPVHHDQQFPDALVEVAHEGGGPPHHAASGVGRRTKKREKA